MVTSQKKWEECIQNGGHTYKQELSDIACRTYNLDKSWTEWRECEHCGHVGHFGKKSQPQLNNLFFLSPTKSKQQTKQGVGK